MEHRIADWDKAREEMADWHWWGVPTFFRRPLDTTPGASDIAVLGVPHSSGNGSTWRDQHMGPRAVRNISALYRRIHARFGFIPWDICSVVDAGDVPIPEAMVNDITVRHIEQYATQWAEAGTRLVSIGGDHAITGPLLKAVASPKSTLTGGAPVALVHFDSHTDSFSNLEHWLGNRRSAGHWSSYTAKEGAVDAHKSTQIGIKNYFPEWGSDSISKDLGYRVIGFDESEEMGWEAIVSEVRERVGDSPVYVTFDLDVLDPADAPGVSNLEPGPGMRIGDAIKILQGLRGLNIVGADIVCLMPTTDNPNQITAMNANVVAFELISLMADKIKDEAK